jgi:hypothetical protein
VKQLHAISGAHARHRLDRRGRGGSTRR